jgi:hypothetical protein
MNKISDILNGTLIGDANIRSNKGKYPCYKLTAKDRNFLENFQKILQNFGIKSWIVQDNKNSNTFALGFYINTCPFVEFRNLRDNWYQEINRKTIKTVPKDLEITPTILLYWYLGDGSLIRRKNDSCRVPYIVLATNAFSKEDIEFLIQKLKKLDLNFYPVKYKSGFTGKESGYCLYSKTQDGTPFRFFKLMGECPKEISNCSTGRKGIYHEEKFFKDKWPTEDDWMKILSNVNSINEILKKRREKLGISKKELSELTNISLRHIRHIEFGDRLLGISNFRKVLKALNLDISYLLNNIR